MLKRLLTALAVLGGVTTGGATPVNPLVLLTPGESDMSAACDTGYKAGESAERDTLKKFQYRLAFDVTLVPAVGNTAVRCYLDAAALKVKSPVNPSTWTMLVDIQGVSQTFPADTKSWAVALLLTDSDGKEVGRLSPHVEIEGDAGDWNSCAADLGCKWNGTNYYEFLLSVPFADRSFVDTLIHATSATLLVSRGKGIERYPVDSAQLGKWTF